MKKLGFDLGLIKWKGSYLSGRRMKVKINNSLLSEYTIMNTGVPAGRILGPVLILIYINDLPSIFEKYYRVLLFADDCKLMIG